MEFAGLTHKIISVDDLFVLHFTSVVIVIMDFTIYEKVKINKGSY